eukprot:jgi/Botrbrau1/19201/Bobra.0077s0104.1
MIPATIAFSRSKGSQEIPLPHMSPRGHVFVPPQQRHSSNRYDPKANPQIPTGLVMGMSMRKNNNFVLPTAMISEGDAQIPNCPTCLNLGMSTCRHYNFVQATATISRQPTHPYLRPPPLHT